MLHSAILRGQLHQRKPGDASPSSHHTEPTVYQTSQEQLAVAHFLDRGKNNGFPFLDILEYLKNTHKNPKFGRVRQIPIWELGWEFPD